MTALFVLSVARPALPHGTRDRVAALLGRAPRPAGVAGAVPLDRALQASLEQDGVLARELGARRADGVLRPDHAFVVSRFSMPGGRAVSIYTPLTAWSEDQETDVSYVSEGGVW